jgi:hypothetical protein
MDKDHKVMCSVAYGFTRADLQGGKNWGHSTGTVGC